MEEGEGRSTSQGSRERSEGLYPADCCCTRRCPVVVMVAMERVRHDRLPTQIAQLTAVEQLGSGSCAAASGSEAVAVRNGTTARRELFPQSQRDRSMLNDISDVRCDVPA